MTKSVKTHDEYLSELDPKIIKALEYLESQKRTNEVRKAFQFISCKVTEPESKKNDAGDTYETKRRASITFDGGITIFTYEEQIIETVLKANSGAWLMLSGRLEPKAVEKSFNDRTYASVDLKLVWTSAEMFFNPKSED